MAIAQKIQIKVDWQQEYMSMLDKNRKLNQLLDNTRKELASAQLKLMQVKENERAAHRAIRVLSEAMGKSDAYAASMIRTLAEQLGLTRQALREHKEIIKYTDNYNAALVDGETPMPTHEMAEIMKDRGLRLRYV